MRLRAIAAMALALAGGGNRLSGQQWDLPANAADQVGTLTEGKLKLGVEVRGRYESRTGNTFGGDPDVDTSLFRSRFSATYQPAPWLKFSAMVQDSRSPGYGPNAPSTVRDPADLQEGYIEIRPDSKTGFGLSVGRRMLNYGEGRLIGSPQWSNLSRTWDHARLSYGLPRARFEFLLVSPVKIRIGEFNQPVLGDRIWGSYNTFNSLRRSFDIYWLRHDQNRPGGFTGGSPRARTDRLETSSFGGRATGPVGAGIRYSLEGIVQTGRVGAARHRAGAWFSSLGRRWMVGRRLLDVSAEYKFASGTNHPADASRDSTFDQMYPANHDKFGHEDLFGWRNIHNLRSLSTLAVTRNFAVNFMYDSYWLASARDALYSGAGRAIARSAAGTAGRHVGQEADLFGTYRYAHFQIGAGYGYLFKGEFVRQATRGVSPGYIYFFHTYSF